MNFANKYFLLIPNRKQGRCNHQIGSQRLQSLQWLKDQYQKQQYPWEEKEREKKDHIFIIKYISHNKLYDKAFLYVLFTCSQRGVLNTLSVPYFSFSPKLHLKTPPNLTSSPKSTALEEINTSYLNHKMILFSIPINITFYLLQVRCLKHCWRTKIDSYVVFQHQQEYP